MSTEPAAMVLDMLADAINSINNGESGDDVVIRHLGQAINAVAAISVYADSNHQHELISSWPSLSEAKDLLNYLLNVALKSIKGHVTIDHEAGIGHIIFILIPPDNRLAPQGGFGRIIAFARTNPIDEEVAVILERACRPLMALWPQTARAYAQKRAAATQDISLTPREHEILTMLARGMLATKIAIHLDLSPRTVHKHLGSLYRKFGTHDRLVAVSIARARGLLD